MSSCSRRDPSWPRSCPTCSVDRGEQCADDEREPPNRIQTAPTRVNTHTRQSLLASGPPARCDGLAQGTACGLASPHGSVPTRQPPRVNPHWSVPMRQHNASAPARQSPRVNRPVAGAHASHIPAQHAPPLSYVACVIRALDHGRLGLVAASNPEQHRRARLHAPPPSRASVAPFTCVIGEPSSVSLSHSQAAPSPQTFV